MLGFAAFDDGCHDFRSDGREKDAVAKVAGGDVVAGSLGFAEDGERVGSSGAKAGPAFENSGVAQFGDQRQRRMMEALDGGEVGALVESGFFDGGADEKASVATRDQVRLGRSHDVLQQSARRHYEAEHLSFDWARRKSVGSNLAGPCSSAVDHLGGVKCGLDGGDAGGAAIRYSDSGDFIARREVHASILGGLPRGSG